VEIKEGGYMLYFIIPAVIISAVLEWIAKDEKGEGV